MYRRQPSVARVKELLPCALRQVPDCPFRNSILEVGIDPTEGKLLSSLLARQLERGVCESAVVAVIMLDGDAVLGGKTFECQLGLDSLFGG